MSYEKNLAAVRHISESATLKPSPRALRIKPLRPFQAVGPAVKSWEELHPPLFAGRQSNSGNKPRRANLAA